MDDAVAMEVVQGQGYIMAEVDFHVEGKWLLRFSSTSSVSSTGRADSVSVQVLKYCKMLGCPMPLRKKRPCLN